MSNGFYERWIEVLVLLFLYMSRPSCMISARQMKSGQQETLGNSTRDQDNLATARELNFANDLSRRCKRKLGFRWKNIFPVIYDCLPVEYFYDTEMRKLLSEKSGTLPLSSPTHDSPTTRTLRSSSKYALKNVSSTYNIEADATVLLLWRQRLVSVEEYAFVGLSELRKLNLQGNDLSYLSEDAFQGLPKLTELDLSDNRLTTIPDCVFRDLKHLDILNIKLNEIIYILNSVFCGLENLSTLDLSYNSIKHIDEYAFSHFRSSYTVSIDLSFNKLKTPKVEWLMYGPQIDSKVNCKRSKDSASKFRGNAKGMQLGDLTRPENNYSLPPVRILKASNNSWSCECDSDLQLIEFIRRYKSVLTAQRNGAKAIEDTMTAFRLGAFNRTINITDPKIYANWRFNMPCRSDTNINIGKLTLEQQAKIEETCCKILPNTVVKKDSSMGKQCAPEDSSITENHVTIIGIVIVFTTPILLTLCPDCNRTVSPSPNSGGMTSGGKFGAVSINANNNNKRKTSFFNRDPERRPFANGRFCLVVQDDNKEPKKIIIPKLV